MSGGFCTHSSNGSSATAAKISSTGSRQRDGGLHFPDCDLEAAFVVFLFAAGVVLVAAVLSEQAADSFRLSFGVPLPLLVSRVAHGAVTVAEQ
ncbi:hypothetical protein E1193_05975 [Micromonospora sp. KC606]|uniref:hypothetical protein n=1 Tax=Micromonospora sp. KC606 TaxID=2530379 RepID=UPI00104E5CF5|nr:hypothetical protein [Micromonospora sp. KC606]TDC84284.1 hypothetical protein E1193_05975 [Micromonospora sp. KC606]